MYLNSNFITTNQFESFIASFKLIGFVSTIITSPIYHTTILINCLIFLHFLHLQLHYFDLLLVMQFIHYLCFQHFALNCLNSDVSSYTYILIKLYISTYNHLILINMIFNKLSKISHLITNFLTNL